MRFLLQDSYHNYTCIDFTTEMCTHHWVSDKQRAKRVSFNPTLVATWPVRLLPDTQKIDYLADNYDIIEIDSILIDEFKQLNPEYFI